ncbi:MAG TPA: hypothetical protein DCR24_09920, partial [Bacillus bacterium]|nr:hypothetical protein [Bacillus sp. (in: firmicutes)]
MRKKALLASVFLSWFLLFSFQPASALTDVKVQKLVLFKENVDVNIINETNSIILEKYINLPAAKIEIPADKLEYFLESQSVLAMENEQKAEAVGQTIDWSTSAVQAERAWKANYTGKNVKVAILDSGIAPHPHLK